MDNYICIDVPDNATNDEIADICAEKAPRGDYDYFRWEEYDELF